MDTTIKRRKYFNYIRSKGGIIMDYATLSNEQNFTVFRYGEHTIRFKAPYSLEKYSLVKEWDHGYLVVMAKYSHNMQDEEEYIDLIPILENLYFDAEEFLEPIKEVRIEYA